MKTHRVSTALVLSLLLASAPGRLAGSNAVPIDRIDALIGGEISIPPAH